jgi:hypothetical protein
VWRHAAFDGFIVLEILHGGWSSSLGDVSMKVGKTEWWLHGAGEGIFDVVD